MWDWVLFSLVDTIKLEQFAVDSDYTANTQGQMPPPPPHELLQDDVKVLLSPIDRLPENFDHPTPPTSAQPSSSFVDEVVGECLHVDCHTAISYRGYCKTHGGQRRCKVLGCTKGNQGQNLCIAHGGGKRCSVETCERSAQSHGLCKAHGGGARCTIDGCDKSSQGGGRCRKHGGGRR
ncbi:hypothetical protein As57867_005305, partial [Aphanomyces stellatus]